MDLTLETRLIEAMEHLDEDTVINLTCQLLKYDYSKYDIFKLLDAGSRKVGKKFEKGEYFIADLIVSGNIYANVIDSCNLAAFQPTNPVIGSVLIGVVQADIHEIGKDIVCSQLRSEAFSVTDLGVDVSPEEFVDVALRLRPDVVALSGIMANSVNMMAYTIRCLDQAGVRSFASILIGGACVNEDICKLTSADGWSRIPMDTLNFCLNTVKEKR